MSRIVVWVRQRLLGPGAPEGRLDPARAHEKRVRFPRRYLVMFCLLAAGGCRRETANIVGTPVPAPQLQPRPASPAPSPPTPEPLRSPDGRPWAGAERVDADVVRVRSLSALLVEANEIRCPHVVRTSGPAVKKDIDPWRVEGDLVETDALVAHTVSARLIIADEIRAMVVRKLEHPHHWAGGGGPSAVRNRVSAIPELTVPAEDPSF